MTRLLLLLAFLCSSQAYGQYNVELISHLDYDAMVNDVWGYAAPDGTEYAILGLQNGVSFVSLADPGNPQEVAFIAGDNSNWRDIKTYGTYAYSVADQGSSGEGITAFDLTGLPDTVTFQRTTYSVPGYPGIFRRTHNLYIDESTGILYTAGGSEAINGGGILLFDLTETPMSPTLRALAPNIYSHDVFVQDGIMYASEMFIGDLAIYDVSDIDSITDLGRIETPYTFTHNAWATKDGHYVFTTDEKANASVAAYDVSDPADIKLIDEYRPAKTVNKGVIPHNVHVIDDYLSISYYTDGLRVVDASVRDNLVEVAYYDTWLGEHGGFAGAWGAYPYLPSGLTLISDRQTGLYVVDVDYRRAARIHGTILTEENGAPANAAVVTLSSPLARTSVTDALGNYKSGVPESGVYQVNISAPNYDLISFDVYLENGVDLQIDTFLSSNTQRSDVNVAVMDNRDQSPLQQAVVVLSGANASYNLITNDEGRVSLPGVFVSDTFDVYITAWGYQTEVISQVTSAELNDVMVELAVGYQDDFVADLGWEVSGDASLGAWERGIPQGTSYEFYIVAPDMDAPDDIGQRAYVTGLAAGSSPGANDVDDGFTTLISPRFGPTGENVTEMTISFQYWFFNFYPGEPATDEYRVSLSNGIETVDLAIYTDPITPVTGEDVQWLLDSFSVTDYLAITDSMQLIVTIGDQDQGNWVEGGFDAFRVTEKSLPTSTSNGFGTDTLANLYPNPSATAFTLEVPNHKLTNPILRISDVSGRLIARQRLQQFGGRVSFGESLRPGFYLVELLDGSQRQWVGKVVKR